MVKPFIDTRYSLAWDPFITKVSESARRAVQKDPRFRTHPEVQKMFDGYGRGDTYKDLFEFALKERHREKTKKILADAIWVAGDNQSNRVLGSIGLNDRDEFLHELKKHFETYFGYTAENYTPPGTGRQR